MLDLKETSMPDTHDSTNYNQLAVGPFVAGAFSDDVQAKLRKPLETDEVLTRKQGTIDINYLPTYFVIRNANEIFGEGNWTQRIVSIDRYEYLGPPKRDDAPQKQVTVVATVEVQIRTNYGWLPYQDVGTGTAERLTAFELDKANKGAVSDGLKRCFRMLGEQFGNNLYDKDSSQPVRATQPVPTRVPPPSNDEGHFPCSIPGCTGVVKGFTNKDNRTISADVLAKSQMSKVGAYFCPDHNSIYRQRVEANNAKQ